MIESNGGQGVLEGDHWAPTSETDATKGYIQVGRFEYFKPGMSGWPSWAETTGSNTVCTMPLPSNSAALTYNCF